MSKKVMIVSGGASGLGLAAGIKFSKNGYNVVLIDINEEKGKQAEEKILLLCSSNAGCNRQPFLWCVEPLICFLSSCND